VADSDLKPGEMIASYRVVRKIGEGGMGSVYEALHEFTQRRAAVKLLHAFRADADYKARFMQEARALAQQDHPNVVRLIDANITPEGDIWIAMEYLEGCTLRELSNRMGAMQVETALHHLVEICDGVAAGHEIGIVHCDLKPENVFITRQGATKVVDFGAARAPSLGVIRSTAAILASGGKRSIIGTPEYMSPEHLQAQGARERTDIFAIGTMGWEMLANRHWILNADGSKPHVWEVVRRQIEAVAPLLTEVRPDVPEDVALILQRAMEKDAALRWPSAAALSAAFREARTRYLAGVVIGPGDQTPEKKWIGPGAWAAHCPPVSLPLPTPPVDDPSKRVLVQVGAGPVEAVAAPVPLPIAPPAIVPAGVERPSPPAVAVLARAEPLPAPVALRTDTTELPPPQAPAKTEELSPSTPGPMTLATTEPAPPRQATTTHTTVPRRFDPSDRTSQPPRAHSARWLVLGFLTGCGLLIVGLALWLAGRSSPTRAVSLEDAAAPAADAGVLATVGTGSAEPNGPDPMRDPDAGAAAEDAGAPDAPPRDAGATSTGPRIAAPPPSHVPAPPKPKPAAAATPAAATPAAPKVTLPFGPKR
jgi:serine/threonine-protein kinase